MMVSLKEKKLDIGNRFLPGNEQKMVYKNKIRLKGVAKFGEGSWQEGAVCDVLNVFK